MCYRKFDRGIVDMSWRERSKALTVRRLMKRQSAMSLSGATPAAAAPRIADPVVDLAATLNYWKITNAAMNAKARFRDAYMTAPVRGFDGSLVRCNPICPRCLWGQGYAWWKYRIVL